MEPSGGSWWLCFGIRQEVWVVTFWLRRSEVKHRAGVRADLFMLASAKPGACWVVVLGLCLLGLGTPLKDPCGGGMATLQYRVKFSRVPPEGFSLRNRNHGLRYMPHIWVLGPF